MAELTPVMQNFILHWGEMGSTWGLNRTTAQMYALIYLSSTPITAEEISETLSLARSTVSTGLRELQSWSVVKLVHVLGDRRDHFETISDVWEMFRVILIERKRREIDPTLALLRASVGEFQECGADQYVGERLDEMLDFFETMITIYHQVEHMQTNTLKKMARMGDSLVKVLSRAAQN
ncbi:GbsR/MarR family transcriptional regulator [Chloroflexota bacterium]